MAFMNAGFGARLAPERFAAFFGAAFFAAFFGAAFFAAFFAVDFFAVDFFIVFLAADFFIVFFAAFFAGALRPAAFRAGAFLAPFFAAFFGAAFFAAGFLAAAFLPDFFVRAIDGLRQRVFLVRRNEHLSGAHQNESLSLYTQQENLRGCVGGANAHPDASSMNGLHSSVKGPPADA
jgi:hypothetical protein